MRHLAAAALLLLASACTTEVPRVRWELQPGGVEVRATSPLAEVTLRRADGSVAARRTLPRPAETVWMGHPWSAGERYQLDVRGPGGADHATVNTPAVAVPVWLRVEAPIGQGSQLVRDGEVVAVPRIGTGPLRAGLVLQAVEPCTVEVSAGALQASVPLGTAGERHRLAIPLQGPTQVAVRTADWQAQVVLEPIEVSAMAARDQLQIAGRVFPAEAGGEANPALAQGRVTLPAPWWTSLLAAAHLGTRAADDQAPWAWEAVRLSNRGKHPLNVLLRARVEDEAGLSSPIFRPRLREYDGGSDQVTALLRVPAEGEATAVLPLYVDRTMAHTGEWQRVLTVLPLGADEPLFEARESLFVSRSSPWVSILFGLGLLTSLAGVLFLAGGVPRWLRREPTSALMTIALFGALHFSVVVAAQALNTVLALGLGPFAVFVSGLGDTVLRTAVLVTLLTLLPRTGVASLALITGWLLRGLVLGSFDPVGALFLLASVLVLELSLWLAGITRDTGWQRRGVGHRWVRLALALSLAGGLRSAIGISSSMVLYRLYYADAYVWALVLLPGMLYPALASLPATRFAHTLREVQA